MRRAASGSVVRVADEFQQNCKQMPLMPITLPNLLLDLPAGAKQPRGITLVVYAPLGENNALSNYPSDQPTEVEAHPLAQAMRHVASKGVNTFALLDRFNGSTWLQAIPAGQPNAESWSNRGALDMRAAHNLAEHIAMAQQRHPGTALVLALEGHGTGFMPDVAPPDGRPATQPPPPTTGAPLLAMGSPMLPGGAPMSTRDIGRALEMALPKLPWKIGVIHFNNCFNMSMELLHSVAPYAEFATGYLNYNFFSAGSSYGAVFKRITDQASGRASTADLARWFAQGNRDALKKTPEDQPTAGGAVQLQRMGRIADAIDALAGELVTAMTAKQTARLANVDKIRSAIAAAQQYDSDSDMSLEVPDALTDIGGLAFRLKTFDGDNAAAVTAAAANVLSALGNIRVYGVDGSPYIDPDKFWQLDEPHLAMNIFLPDPLRQGKWDWRSPEYLRQGPVQPKHPPIAFLSNKPNWVKFIIEYHRDVPFVALLPVMIPTFPVARISSFPFP
jgi:hypothetical protein